MKICHVVGSHREVGGLEKNVKELAEAQLAEGHQVTILAAKGMIGYFDGVAGVRPVKMERSRRDPRLRWELAKCLQELDPDIVHAHANKAAEIVARSRGGDKRALVATVHGVKKRTNVFQAFDKVIVPSEVVAQTLSGIDAQVIWNAVPAFEEDWKKEAESLRPPFYQEGRTVIYAAGRFAEVKGYDLLLRALAEIPDGALWLVGDGPAREELVRLTETLGVSERVWMPGFLKESELVGLMPLSSLFVISSRREAGPYTLAQALRSQTAILSTKVGMGIELLGEEQLCGEASVPNLVAGLKRFLADPGGYRQAMESVFAIAERELAIEGMIAKVTSVYDAALAMKSQ